MPTIPIPSIRLRRLTESDLLFADHIRDLAGWNQTLADWRRFRALEPEGCFLAECEGVPAGTATTFVHGPELAWIGMVLVHPQMRRRGVGRALLEHCVDDLLSRGIQCIKLDATPMGQPVYAALGFKEEWTLTRWQHQEWNPAASPPEPILAHNRRSPVGRAFAGHNDGVEQGRNRTILADSQADSDFVRFIALTRAVIADESFNELDRTAFGVSRRRLVNALLPISTVAIALNSATAVATGYAMSRPGARAHYLGPVAAMSSTAGLALVDEALRRAGSAHIFWDIPDPNTEASNRARAHGFQPQRSLVRMYLGDLPPSNDALRQFALTGPETG